MRKIGHVSYSAYLVHWPVFIYAREVAAGTGMSGLSNPVVVCVMSFALGALLYRLVETRFRLAPGEKAPVRQKVLVAFTFCMALGIAALAQKTEGWNTRIPCTPWADSLEMQTSSSTSPTLFLPKSRFRSKWRLVGSERGMLRALKPLQRDTEALPRTSAMMVGNSLSRHLTPMLKSISNDSTLPYLIVQGPGCQARPRESAREAKRRQCRNYNENIWAVAEKLPANTTVYIAYNWNFDVNSADVALAMSRDFADLGLQPVIVGSPGAFSNDNMEFFSCFYLKRIWKYFHIPTNTGLWKLDCEQRHFASRGNMGMDNRLKRRVVESDLQVQYISPLDAVCKKESDRYVCDSTARREDGVLESVFHPDGVHLSYWGSVSYASSLGKHFRIESQLPIFD